MRRMKNKAFREHSFFSAKNDGKRLNWQICLFLTQQVKPRFWINITRFEQSGVFIL